MHCRRVKQMRDSPNSISGWDVLTGTIHYINNGNTSLMPGTEQVTKQGS